MPLLLLLVLAIPVAADTPTKGVRADILAWIEDAEKKLVGLAEAMPAEKYGWRPGEGVRSVGEVYMHAATANLGIPRMIGTDAPMKMDQGMEKSITEKAKIVEMLKKSFAHVKEVIGKVSDADLDKATKMFGQESTYRNVLMLLVAHNHEHLGQSIAYARTNGVTPPWSMGGQ
ncbi:MAG: DinB family protein [Bacteroidota bacterium]